MGGYISPDPLGPAPKRRGLWCNAPGQLSLPKRRCDTFGALLWACGVTTGQLSVREGEGRVEGWGGDGGGVHPRTAPSKDTAPGQWY